jgi:hypothetical protein
LIVSSLHDIRRRHKLPEVLDDFPHFRLHYALRNPPEGPGYGRDGVADLALVRHCGAALERLYDTMTARPFQRPAPKTGASGKTAVYLLDADMPLTTCELDGTPYIILPNGHDEPTSALALQRAAAEAVHEAVHAFNFGQRLPSTRPYEPWEWFDEGLAVFFEADVLQDNCDYWRFVRAWVAAPDNPLDDPAACYQAFVFIKYLAERFGVALVNDVWLRKAQTPWQALSEVLNLPDATEIFADYCRQSFPSSAWERQAEGETVLTRFGARALQQSFRLTTSEPKAVQGRLRHLSCHYYRCYLPEQAEDLSIELRLLTSSANLRGAVALYDVAQQPVGHAVLALNEAENTPRLAATLTADDCRTCDHLIVSISNCGLSRADDETAYELWLGNKA